MTEQDQAPDVAVVGAGIIGVACALALVRTGRRVMLLDREEPGRGASFGNAGHLATEQVFPIADLSILQRVPAMLCDPLGPLRLDWRYAPRALPWFARLIWNLRPAAFRRSVAGIQALNARSLPAWQRLLGSIGRPDLLQQAGSLLVCEHAQSWAALRSLQERLREWGVPAASWPVQAMRETVPQLSERFQGGLFFPDTGHFGDPHGVVMALFAAARAQGLQFVRTQVWGAQLCEGGVTLQTAQGSLPARQVLIACGAHSAPLTAMLTGRRVPLETERGYHLMLPHERERLPFAVTSFERRFIMTPMDDGLRLAGTVEFAGLERPAAMARAWQLHRLSQGLFREDLNAGQATAWMGFRPSLPDSLPVIDRVCDGRVLLAFGHQHLGLTQAAVTAETVARWADEGSGETAHDALPRDPYRLDRF